MTHMEHEKTHKKSEQARISTPQAIIVAGVLIMVGLLLTKGNTAVSNSSKTFSAQVGIAKDKLTACIKATDLDARNTQIQSSVASAMKGLPDDQRGTPYTIVIGKDGIKTEIRGADQYESTKKIVDDALLGKITTEYKGDVALSEPTDHVMGNPNATVTLIEYSDFQCPFCKQFNPTLKRIVEESNGNVRWIYRSWPLHQHSFEYLVAADCVGKLKGDEAFFKYSDLLFSLLDTGDSVSEKL